MKDGLLSQVLESLLVVRSLVVQKTKLISDCGHLLKELLDGLLEESFENKRHFVYACITGLQAHVKTRKDSTLMVSVAIFVCTHCSLFCHYLIMSFLFFYLLVGHNNLCCLLVYEEVYLGAVVQHNMPN
mgnify:CR=1 FL=1